MRVTRSKARALDICPPNNKLTKANPQKAAKRRIPIEERTDLTSSKKRKLIEDISVINIVGDHYPNTVGEKPNVPTKRSNTVEEKRSDSSQQEENNSVVEPKEPNLSLDHANSNADIPLTVSIIDYKINEVVWAKIKGYSFWPGKIKSFPSSQTAEIVWFNDYRRTKVFKTQMKKFLPHFEECAKKFDDVVGLRCAAQEGLIYFGSTMNN